MNNEFEFRVTENKLHEESGAFRWLSASNGCYDATLFYCDDYAADLRNKALKGNCLIVDVKSRKVDVDLKYMAGTIYIDMGWNDSFDVQRVDKIKLQLDKAQASASALQELIDRFFPDMIRETATA